MHIIAVGNKGFHNYSPECMIITNVQVLIVPVSFRGTTASATNHNKHTQTESDSECKLMYST